jgi:hypothetical protein
MPESAGILIFLDFDGVLRRKDAPLYRFEKPLLAVLEAVVRRIRDAEVVVMSSWREVVELTAIRKLFSTDVAARIVGVTPFVPHGRYREILAYLKQNGAEDRRWVAVDDDPFSYPRGVPLVLVDPAKGFGTEEAQRLVEIAGRSSC